MGLTACLVVNPVTFDDYALLYNCTAAVRASDSMLGFELDAMTLAWPTSVHLVVFFNSGLQC